MTTETILTDEQIMHLWDTRVGDPCESMPLVDSDKTAFARAIEQAVLQSPEVQALRKDAGRYRYLRDDLRHDDERWDAVSSWNHSNIPTAEFDSAVDAAMEKQT